MKKHQDIVLRAEKSEGEREGGREKATVCTYGENRWRNRNQTCCWLSLGTVDRLGTSTSSLKCN